MMPLKRQLTLSHEMCDLNMMIKFQVACQQGSNNARYSNDWGLIRSTTAKNYVPIPVLIYLFHFNTYPFYRH